jgi:DNA-binding beta-propeller fold protein YncE
MKSPILSIIIPVLISCSGCHQVTEYQVSDQSHITFIRTSDFQVDKTFEGIQRGRSLVSVGVDELIVLSADGVLYRLDTEEMAIDNSYSIGGSSGTGYHDAVIANNGHLYVLGPGSQVIEVNLSTNTVEDQFTPGAQPIALAASPNTDRVYFVDAAEDYIGEIKTANNSTGFTSHTYCPLADVMVEPGEGRHIVAVGSDDFGILFGIWLDLSTSARRFLDFSAGSPGSSVSPMIVEDSIWVISCPEWGSENGFVRLVQGYVIHDNRIKVDVDGHPLEVCFNRNSGFAGNLSVLSKTGSGSTMVSIFGFFMSYMIPELKASIQIDGYPRDIISPSFGDYIVVLTSD